jgi:hypothetical protein
MKPLAPALLLLVSLVIPSIVQADTEALPPSLGVQGEAVLRVPADQLRLRLGVITTHDLAEKALDENSRRLERVINALRKVGLDKEEYATGHFSIQPIWEPRPRSGDNNRPPRILGYRVSNSLNIRTGQLHKAGELIQTATEAGANNIGALQFTLADPDSHRAEAIAAATKKGGRFARAAAEAAGVKLEGIISIQVDQARFTPIMMSRQRPEQVRLSTMAAPAAPPIDPDSIEVRATVSLEYRIVMP